MPLDKINKSLIRDIERIVNQNKGKILLKFNIYEEESNMYINLFSRSFRINMTDAFLKYFEDNPDIVYKIN